MKVTGGQPDLVTIPVCHYNGMKQKFQNAEKLNLIMKASKCLRKFEYERLRRSLSIRSIKKILIKYIQTRFQRHLDKHRKMKLQKLFLTLSNFKDAQNINVRACHK